MGRYSQTVAASIGGGEVSGLGSSKADDVGISTTENRDGTAGEVGEDTGAGEESGLVAWGACCGEFAAGNPAGLAVC
ncbi:MAG TPA: hypothetical protein VIH78_16045 [Terriglobales bacterium]